MTEKLTAPTPASAWRQATQEGELIRLPGCGHVARLVRPPLSKLVLVSNGVPNPLSRNIQKFLTGAAPPKDEQTRWENYQANTRGLQEIAALCLAEPKLRLEGTPAEGEIGPEDLTDMDYTWIYFTWLEGAAQDVAPFRVQPSEL